MNKKIGLIAGSGQFPLLFAEKAKSKGYSVCCAAFRNEADPSISDHVEAFEWMYLGQVNRLITFFKKNGVQETVLLGAIQKTKIFTDVRPDLKAISAIAKMRHTHDDGILSAFAGLLEDEGIIVCASTFLLPELLAVKGCWTKRKPNRSEKADIDFGWNTAKEIGRLDIGQCVVVGGGSVLAVEAVEGTDATIERGGKLGRGHAVVVKICKPNQDQRFDIPAVGAQTIQTMHNADAKALAVEAGKTVVFDREEMVSLADQYGICIVALENGNDISDHTQK